MSDGHLGFAAVYKLNASYSKVVRQEPPAFDLTHMQLIFIVYMTCV